MLRITLFAGTNIAILVLISSIFQLLGFEQYLASQGINSSLTTLLLFCGLFGIAGSFISLLLSKILAKRSTGTIIISEPATVDEQWLLDTIAKLAKSAGIGMPEIGIFPTQQANAFATGWNKNSALVAVSQGLLQRFSRDEVRAVLAHEIGHIANGDMVTLTLVQGVMNTFVLFFARVIGSIIDKAVFKNSRGSGMGYFITVMALQVVLGILASFIVRWFSRWREFRADAAGASLTGRRAMIGALQQLQRETQAQIPNQMPETLAACAISSGWRKKTSRLLMTHPPLEERITALKQGL